MLCQQLHPLEASQNLTIMFLPFALKGSVYIAYSASKAALIGLPKVSPKRAKIRLRSLLSARLCDEPQTLTLEPHQISHLCRQTSSNALGL